MATSQVLTQDMVNSLASRYRMKPSVVTVEASGVQVVVLERDAPGDKFCQAVVRVLTDGSVEVRTGLCREEVLVDNGATSAETMQVAFKNASAAFDLLVRSKAKTDS